MNICFFGVGGVGGYYGTLVTRYCNDTGKGKTYFIARGRHKDAILEKGLLLKKDGGKEEIRLTLFLLGHRGWFACYGCRCCGGEGLRFERCYP